MKIIAHLDDTSFFAVDFLHQAAGAFLSGSRVGVGAAAIPTSSEEDKDNDNTSFFAVDLLHQAAGAFLSGSSVGVGAAAIPRSRPNSNNRAAHAEIMAKFTPFVGII